MVCLSPALGLILNAADPSSAILNDLEKDARTVCAINRPLKSGARRELRTINTIILHHTAIDTLSGSLSTLRSRGTSYHYVIDTDGVVVHLTPLNRVAFQAAGANRPAIGISFVGGVEPTWRPTDAQWSAAKSLIAALVRRNPNIKYLIGHGDVRDTNAGEPYNVNFDQLLTELRNVRLQHLATNQEPLATFRRSAAYLLEHPRTAAEPRPSVPTPERLTCTGGKIRILN